MRFLESMSDRSNKRCEEPALTRERESTTVREASQRHCCLLPGMSGLTAKKIQFGVDPLSGAIIKSIANSIESFLFFCPQPPPPSQVDLSSGEVFCFARNSTPDAVWYPGGQLPKENLFLQRFTAPEFSIGSLKYFLKICWLSIVNCISPEYPPQK